jgi:Zn-finger nucleic acid-binding protein
MNEKGDPMKCPNCKDGPNLSMSERLGIEIDYCPECRGVWLDRGELDKILEKSLSEKTEIHTLPREKIQEVIYRDSDSHKKDFYKQKRKKSFLEELFD